MSTGTNDPAYGTTTPGEREVLAEAARLWWVALAGGIAWITVALIILQFDEASITTIGVIVGLMFITAGFQQLALARVAPTLRWLWALFGVLFLIAGIICFINPEETFVGLADVLGFLFLVVGVWWTIQAFLERGYNDVWWLGLLSGILMIVLAFWTSGQFFIEKGYVLLIFAGIWALMHGILDIVQAFQLRSLRDKI